MRDAGARERRGRRRPGARLLAVDQFEELFTLCRDEAERAAFVERARRRPPRATPPSSCSPCARTSTARCAAYPALARLLGANHVLVGPMQRDELRRAIELPGAAGRAARRARARRPAAGRRRASSRVRCRCCPPPCSSCGSGATGAASRSPPTSAPAACAARSRGSPSPPTRASTRRSRPSRGASCCGWPARTRAAAPSAGASRSTSSTPTATRTCAECSTCSPTAGSSRVSDGTAEVAHEALLREWPRLRGWLEEDAEGRRLHHHLAIAAREWDAGGRDPGELYRGARLGVHARLERRARGRAQRASSARSSTPSRGRERGRGAARPAHEPAAAALLAGVARAARARGRRRRAVPRPARPGARRGAHRRRASASARRRWSSTDLDRSLLLARQGVALEDSLRDAQQPAGRADAQPRRRSASRRVGARAPATSMALRPDGRALVVGDEHGNVDVPRPGHRPAAAPPYRRADALHPAARVQPGRLAAARRAASACCDCSTAAPAARSPRSRCPAPDLQFINVAFSPDGRTLVAMYERAVGTADARARAAALRRPHRPAPRPPGRARRAAGRWPTSPRSRRTGGGSSPPRATRARWRRRPTHRRPRGPRDRRARPAHAAAAAPLPGLRRQPARSRPDGRTFAAGGDDGSVRFLDLRTGRQRTAPGRHDGAGRPRAVHARRPLPRHRGRRRDGDRLGRQAAAAAETFEGHAGRVAGWPWTAAAQTLYTAAADGTRDHLGPRRRRRLGRPFDAGSGSGPLPLDGHQPRRPHAREHPAGRRRQPRRHSRRLTRRRSRSRRPVADSPSAPRRAVRAGLRAARHARRRRLSTASSASSTRARARSPAACAGTTTSCSRRRRAPTAGSSSRPGWDGTLRAVGHAHPPRARRADPLLGARRRRRASARTAARAWRSPRRRRPRRARRALAAAARAPARRRQPDRLRRASRATAACCSPGAATGACASSRRATGAARARPSWPTPAGSRSVDASPDGRTLVTAGQDGQVRLWDLATRRPIGAPLPGPKDANVVARFAPDGNYVSPSSPTAAATAGTSARRRGSARPARSPAAASRAASGGRRYPTARTRPPAESELRGGGVRDWPARRPHIATASPRPPSRNGSSAAYLEPARTRLGAGTWEAAVRDGAALSFDDAIADALA